MPELGSAKPHYRVVTGHFPNQRLALCHALRACWLLPSLVHWSALAWVSPWQDQTCGYTSAEMRVYQFLQASFLDRHHLHKVCGHDNSSCTYSWAVVPM